LGSIEAMAVALGFRLFGTSALVMMLVTLAGYAIVVILAYSTLSRHLTRGRAFLATLLIVLTPHAINTVTVFPPRQWSIVFVRPAAVACSRHFRSAVCV
jgi:hypothetical protein